MKWPNLQIKVKNCKQIVHSPIQNIARCGRFWRNFDRFGWMQNSNDEQLYELFFASQMYISLIST